MAALTEGKHTGEFILSEDPRTRSRDNVTVTVPASTTLEAGSVLGKITASGKYVAYDNGAADGSQAAAGVLYATLANDTAGAVDQAGVILNTDAEVRSADLVWKSGQSASDKTAGLADLAALGIKARS